MRDAAVAYTARRFAKRRRQGKHRVMSAMIELDTATPAPTPESQSENTDELRARIIEALKSVYDPEIPVNIYDLGLIYQLDIDADAHVKVQITLTAPGCPVAQTFP